MTGMQPQSIDRSIEAASRFLDKVTTLEPAERERISHDVFGSSEHTSAMMIVADEVTSLRNEDRQGKVSAFLVDVERRVDGMKLSPELGDLVKGAARAMLVRNNQGLERATRQLISPFEEAIANPGSAD
jgi:hypothetical protein